MKRGLWLVSFAVLAGAVACGPDEGDKKTDAGPDNTTTPADWGLADKACLRYADPSSPSASYTVEMLLDTTTITGLETWRVIHRYNGWEQRTEWYEVKGNELLLHRRNVAGQLATPDTLHRYTPPPVLLRTNLKTGDSIETVTEARLAGGATLEESQTFRTASLGEDPITGPDGEVTAQKLTLAVESDSLGDVVDRAWFAPQVGFVRFDPAGTEVGEVTLKSVEILEGDAKCVTQ